MEVTSPITDFSAGGACAKPTNTAINTLANMAHTFITTTGR
jgi:lysyl-tRNA synthetase class II